MKWLAVVLLVIFVVVFAFTPDISLDDEFFRIDFDTAAQTEQLRLREMNETQRVQIREESANERTRMVIGLFQFAIAALVVVAVVAAGYRLSAQAIMHRAVLSERQLLINSMPREAQEKLTVVVTSIGDGGYVDIFDDEYVYVHPQTKTLVPFAPTHPQRRLIG